ncbi:MAG: Gfo/Idh/MocA family oxidoreductase [Sphingobium sp.]
MTETGAPRALVVGSGFGCRIHVPALRAVGFDVAGLVGRDPERTARRAEANGIAHAFTDLDEAIRETGAAAVTIASTPHTHAGLTLTAIRHGCHVICEKPMAATAEEGRAMLAAAKAAGVTHLMGNEFRWLPDRAIVMRAIAEGLIGEPRYVTLSSYSALVADPEARMPRWWFDKGQGGGWLGAQGSHIIDQVRSWLGDFESLSAALPTVSEREGGAEDSYTLKFRLKSGVEGVIQQSAGAWGPMGGMTRVAGTRGTIWVENGVVKLATREGVRDLPVTDDLALPPPPEKSDDPRKAFSHFELGPYIRLCELLRAGVDKRDVTPVVPAPTFRDGLAAMEVMDAARLSAAEGGTLVRL